MDTCRQTQKRGEKYKGVSHDRSLLRQLARWHQPLPMGKQATASNITYAWWARVRGAAGGAIKTADGLGVPLVELGLGDSANAAPQLTTLLVDDHAIEN